MQSEERAAVTTGMDGTRYFLKQDIEHPRENKQTTKVLITVL